MLSEEEWHRNVGTDSYPVSFLHEYAVGLIWDILEIRDDGRSESGNEKTEGDRRKGDGKVQLPTLEGGLSDDLLDGIERVTIPDSLQPIGGYIPDLALYDKDLRVVRVIEVVVTNPPPSQKLESLRSRGVEVVQVPVRNDVELRALFPQPVDGRKLRWWHRTGAREGRGVGVNFVSSRSAQSNADEAIDSFMANLRRASPGKRREFLQVLAESGTLDSLYPLRPDNPKREILFTTNSQANGQSAAT